MNRLRKEVADMKITIAILILLLATITATVFTVKESPPTDNPTGETQITFSTTEKETATEIFSVTESETETYEIETETVAPTAERKAEMTTQKPATTKPITTTTQRVTSPPTTQAPVTTTKPVTTTQPVTELVDIDIDYYINYAIEYGKSIGLKYLPDANSCWDTPIGVLADNEYYVIRDIKGTLDFYKNVEGDEYFCVWAERYDYRRYELYIGYSN